MVTRLYGKNEQCWGGWRGYMMGERKGATEIAMEECWLNEQCWGGWGGYMMGERKGAPWNDMYRFLST
jgi:hypothetical protein